MTEEEILKEIESLKEIIKLVSDFEIAWIKQCGDYVHDVHISNRMGAFKGHVLDQLSNRRNKLCALREE